MIQVRSRHPLSRVSTALHRYAHQHRATIQTIHIGHGPCPVVFLLSCPDFQHRLTQTDRRWLMCLPWHVAGGEEEAGGTYLETLSPLEVCKWLDLDPAVPAEFEKFLSELLNHAAEALGEGIHVDFPHQSEHYGQGATEQQVNQRATIPQRIDNKGTKVEELAGTGHHDAQGG